MLLDTQLSLETTKVMLEEYLVSQGPRTLLQLSLQFDDFKSDKAFILLEEWRSRFSMITPVLNKRDDFLFIVGILLDQGRDGLINQALYREAAAQAFLISHEMSSFMIDLSNQSNASITKDTWIFIGGLLASLLTFIIALVLMVLWVRKKMLVRIVGLYNATSRIARGDYSRDVDASGADELACLAQSFNTMQASVMNSLLLISQEKEWVSTILHSIGDAVIAVDSSAIITLMNPVAEKLTGWTSDEAEGHALDEVFVILKEGSRVPQENPVERVLKDGQIVTLANHTILLSRLGPEYNIADSAAPIRLEGGPIEGVVLVFRDVTEHNRIQNLIIQSEKMLSVGGLAAGMAHEINNPLSGMLQTAGVIETRLSVDLPANRDAASASGIGLDAIRSYMESRGIFRMLVQMKDSGARIGRIVNNMLSFARKGPSQVSSHDIRDIVDDAIELAATDYNMKKDYDFKNILIERSYASALPLIPCDSGQIQQVLLNILRNGAQELHEAKTADARFDIRISHDAGLDMVCIELSDNGPGIEEAVRTHVFEPFFTTKPVSVGTGLGLSVSYFIITENHGGQMDVHSVPGKGATFIIRLPVKRLAHSTTPASTQ